MSSVKITINNQTVHGNTRELLLDQLEQAGFHPEYQCRSGLCGACRCRLQQGEVAQLDALALTGKNEILICSAIPKSDVELVFSYPLSTSENAEIESGHHR